MDRNSTVISVHLNFNGNCREAMDFYHSCFGGSLSVRLVGESALSRKWTAAEQSKVLHAELRKKGLVLMGSDVHSEGAEIRNNRVSLTLICRSKREIGTYFGKLSAGGKVIHPLHHFVDGVIGALNDKYGLNWILKY